MQNMLFTDADQDVPSFRRVAADLGSLVGILYRSIEYGTLQNRTYFEVLSDGERPRSHVREMIVWDMAKRFLERNNFVVEEERLIVANEPLVALVLTWGDFQIRILKGRNGILPGCGRSRIRKRFYGQFPISYLDAAGRSRRTKLNLIFLWDFDSVFNLAKIWLVCPKSGGAGAADVTWFWHEEVPLPGIGSGTTPPAQPQSPESDVELEELLRESQEREEDEAGNA
jgi:hypothetical protein